MDRFTRSITLVVVGALLLAISFFYKYKREKGRENL
jgi:LPXTG-motif cell wall-anchored protein